MSVADKISTQSEKEGKLVLPALVLSRFASITPTLIIGLLLVDIAATFDVSVGVAGQLQTAASLVGLTGALLLAALSVRYKSTSLLTIGLAIIVIAAVGSYLSPSLSIMLVLFSLSGLGNSFVPPMTSTIVGERFSPGRKSHAMSWLTAGMSLANVVGAPLISTISSFGGWRLVFLGYAFPLFLLTLILSYTAFPRKDSEKKATRSGYLEGFKGVFSSKSAIACLLGYALATAAYQSILLYAASFYRQRFLLSIGLVSIITLTGALAFTVGGLISGRLVNRFGRKPVTVVAALSATLPIILFTNLADPWVSVGTMFIGRFFTGMLVTSINLLALEQVPKYRGSMMSVGQASSMLGSTLGAITGGWALLVYGYWMIGVVLGGLMLITGLIYQFFSIDPLRSTGSNQK